MLPQLSAAVRVFVCTKPTDMRKSVLVHRELEFLPADVSEE